LGSWSFPFFLCAFGVLLRVSFWEQPSFRMSWHVVYVDAHPTFGRHFLPRRRLFGRAFRTTLFLPWRLADSKISWPLNGHLVSQSSHVPQRNVIVSLISSPEIRFDLTYFNFKWQNLAKLYCQKLLKTKTCFDFSVTSLCCWFLSKKWCSFRLSCAPAFALQVRGSCLICKKICKKICEGLI